MVAIDTTKSACGIKDIPTEEKLFRKLCQLKSYYYFYSNIKGQAEVRNEIVNLLLKYPYLRNFYKEVV